MSGAVPTVAEALASFRAADETARATWRCRVGPVTLRLPNFAWRRRALAAHDLHHVLTQIPCTLAGECRMAAWEFGAGPMPHWGARLFCLPLALAGALVAPRRVLAAYRAGCRSRSLHGAAELGPVLAMDLDAARAMLDILPVATRR